MAITFVTSSRDIRVGYPGVYFPGAQEDDVVIAFVHVPTGKAITAQAGYTALEASPLVQTTGDLQVYWYRVPVTGAHNITDFCADGGAEACAVTAYLCRGCIDSGSPVDVKGNVIATGTPAGPTITPTGNGRGILQFVTIANLGWYVTMTVGSNPTMVQDAGLAYGGWGLVAGYSYHGVQTTQAAYQRSYSQNGGAHIVYALALLPPPPPAAPSLLTASCALPVGVSPSFTTDVTAGNAPLTVNCTDTSTGSPDTWEWAAGNGETSLIQNPTFVFNDPGTYQIRLTASNAQGGGTISKHIIVNPVGVPITFTPPVADFICDVTIGADPLTVVFTNQSTGGDTWDWDWGDGTAHDATEDATHIFNPSGAGPWDFLVRLTTTDSATGMSSSATKTILVTNGAPGTTTPPTAVITASVYTTKEFDPIDFSAVVTNGPATYEWDFGDGGTSVEAAPTHEYSRAGTYTVSLTVSNLYGSTTSSVQIIIVGFINAFRGKGYIYLVDTPNNRVLVYQRADGTYYGYFGSYGVVIAGCFNKPTTLYVDRGVQL